MTIEPPRLTIHVLGAGVGESIVLHLPDGRWGVVDCCASSSNDPQKNATLKFLQDKGVADLEFLCLTHPHQDHFRGMSHLLEHFPVKYFWKYTGFGGQQFLRLIQLLEVEAREKDDSERSSLASELEQILLLIRKKMAQQDPPMQIWKPGTAVPLYPIPDDAAARLRIMSLAPGGEQVERYDAEFERCFRADGTIKARLPDSSHNLASSAFLVEFGRTRVLLGGDVETAGWREVIDKIGARRLAVHAVKVSHHGSTNGYCEGLWGHFSAEGAPRAVVTAYASHSLPRKEALDHIGRHASHLYLTCETALKPGELPLTLNPALKSRLALRMKAPGLVEEAVHLVGRCTLSFDDQGNCIAEELLPPAASLSVPS